MFILLKFLIQSFATTIKITYKVITQIFIVSIELKAASFHSIYVARFLIFSLVVIILSMMILFYRAFIQFYKA